MYAAGVERGNAAIVEHLAELFMAGRLHEADHLMDPEIDWIEPPETIGQHVVEGPEAARAALANWTDQFDSLRFDTSELREEGDRVLHAMRQYVRARGSSVEIEGDLYMVWWFRDGRAVRMEMYSDREQAEAALARQPDS